MLAISAGDVIGSADFVIERMLAVELKFGSMCASRRAYPMGITSMGTDSL
jgi:hypothetical protein